MSLRRVRARLNLPGSSFSWRRFRSGAWFLIVILLSVLFVTTGDLASAGNGRKALALRKNNRFTVHQSASLLVRLTRPVSLRDNFHVKVEGRGRLVGFAFQLQDRTIEPSRRPLIAGFHPGRCLRRGCRGNPPPLFFYQGFNFSRLRLPRGLYRLYVIADGAPARLQIRLDNLHGGRVFRPSDPVTAEIKTLPVRVQEEVSQTVYSAGAASTLTGPGLTFVTLWVNSTEHLASVIGGCFYPKDPPPAPVAFLPGCPTGESEEFINGPRLTNPTWFVYGATDITFLEAVGAYHVTAGRVQEVGSVALWMRY